LENEWKTGSSDRLLKKNSPKSNLTMMSIVGMIGKEVVAIGYKKEVTPSLTLG
jgi:hypothetical protein